MNKIITSHNLLIAGTEDYKLRFIDLLSGLSVIPDTHFIEISLFALDLVSKLIFLF